MRKTKGSLGTKLQRSSLVKDLIKAPPRQKQLKAVPPVSDRGRVSTALSDGAAAAPSLHQPNYFPGWLFCLFSSSAHVALSRRGFFFLLDGFGPDASRLLTWTPRRSLRRKAAAAAAAAAARRSETDTQRLAAGAATMP
ncbi:hypothetical protein AOLI_G00050150 [Acnodon oligacanthus]